MWLSTGSCWLLLSFQHLSAGEPRVGPSVPQLWPSAGLMHPPMQSYEADFARLGSASSNTLQELGGVCSTLVRQIDARCVLVQLVKTRGAILLPGWRLSCASCQLRFHVQTTWDVKAPIETLNGLRLYVVYDPSSAKNKNPVLAKPVGSNNPIHPTATLDRSFTASLYNAAQCTVEVSFLPHPSFQPITIRAAAAANKPDYPWIPPRSTLRTWCNLHALGAAAVAWMWMCPLALQLLDTPARI